MRKIPSYLWMGSWGRAKGINLLLPLTLVLLFWLFPLTFEGVSAQSLDPLNVWTDYACFRNLPDTSQSYVEIYYSFNRRGLKFTQEGETYEAMFFLNLTIEDKLGDTVENRMWNRGSKVNSEEKTQIDYMILDEVEIILDPGDYLLKLSVTDLGSERQGEASLKLKVRAFGEGNIQLSDLELAVQIDPDTTFGMFTKAGRKILPNVWRVFTRESQMAYFYAELYNLTVLPGADTDYVLNFAVLDSAGAKVKDFGTQTRKKPGNSAAILSGVNISTLPPGKYILQVEARDKETEQKASVTKDFIVLGKEVERKEDLVSLEDIEKFKQEVTYIATSRELNMFDQLTSEGKKRFIEEFWRKRDPNPDTPVNEFKVEYYRRIGYANSRFSRNREANDGWNMDMGRVYILYGEPSEIERHPLTSESKSWEQWNYNELEGGVYFIFVDEDGYGVYRLVHSNLKGEVKDSQWEEKVRSESPFR